MNKLVLAAIFMISSVVMAGNDTIVRMYRPFTEGGAGSTLAPEARVSARCDTQSEQVKRGDAWQCQSADTRYDPCFAYPKTEGKVLVCPLSPWHSDATIIDALSVHSNQSFDGIDMNKGKPWAVELDNGLRCLAVEGAKMYRQQPVTFVCRGNQMLLGKLHRCKSEWTVLWSDGQTLDLRAVKEVWF